MEWAIAPARRRDDSRSLYHTPSRDYIPVCSTVALVPAHIFEFAGWMTILLGLVGWYSRFSASLGRLGTLGFLLFFFTGATGGAYALWSDALLGPYMAANSRPF